MTKEQIIVLTESVSAILAASTVLAEIANEEEYHTASALINECSKIQDATGRLLVIAQQKAKALKLDGANDIPSELFVSPNAK